MDNSDSHVEETQDVETNQYEEHLESIHTQGHEEGKWGNKCLSK